MSARFIIVSAINEYYLPLMADLLRSLLNCKTSFSFDIGVLDVGLTENNRQKMISYGVTLRSPGVDIDYPGRKQWEQTAPYFRAMTSRPSLPKYFPGYDAYLWMDADTWVQRVEAVEIMLAAAARHPIFFGTSEDDLAYQSSLNDNTRYDMYRTCFNEQISETMRYRPMLSAGFFAMSAQAPHWNVWHNVLSEQLGSLSEVTQKNFMMEQLCLNLAVYQNKLNIQFMPADYHWITSALMPAYDETTQLFVLPNPPHRPISVLHLSGSVKNTSQSIRTLDGRVLQQPLTYSTWHTERQKRSV